MSQPHLKIKSTVNPGRTELLRLQKKVERLFSALEEIFETEADNDLNSFAPPVDLCETETDICLKVELPGVRPDEINLTVTAKDVCIEGEKEHRTNDQKKLSHFCCERQYGKFKRRIQLRWSINIYETKASLKKGLLEIKLPKLKDRRGQSVRISVTSEEE